MASYPGVPPLLNDAILAADLAVALTTISLSLLSALQSPQQWGIYDSSGNELGASSGLNFLESAALALVSQPTITSTVKVGYLKEMKTANFPIEAGGFANYNKVEMPGCSTVSLTYSGGQSGRASFLAAIDTACKSMNLYSVVTPEVTYANVSLDRYTYDRTAQRGANLITVEITLQEIRQVTATYSTATTPTIANPASTTAAAATNGGMVQPTTPGTSVLQSIANAF